MKIEIKCETENSVSIEELGFFEKDIKVRNGYDIKRMKQSIEKSGFICPLFIWKKDGQDIILDGKTRVIALLSLKKEGYEIGDIPVVYVEAKDEKEAREKVLQVNSRYGKITEASFDFFVKDANLNKADFNIRFDTIHFETVDTYKEKRREAQEEITKVIREGTPVVNPTPIQQPIKPSESFEPTGADEEPEQSDETFVFSGEPVQEIEVCCPYCYQDFKLTLEELVELLGEVEE